MSYQALYRVWRPRKFADVVGQLHITQTLQNAISQNKFSHAYLFSGPRGTGKTSAAKIFAQTINCENMPVKEPCNECEACRSILDGSNADVIEIDAASNTSVDDIREIRDKVKYAPTTVPYKVYIIDEVHMISTSAFNALLKTLEEPPAHVVFILATTEPHDIPLTIISRCQRFDFKAISQQAIVERMQTIIEAEAVEATDEALHAIALAADGAMRDALSILDQAISFSDGLVELKDVLSVTGSVSQQALIDMMMAMHEQKVQEALQLLDEFIHHGKDPGRFVHDMICFLRDLLFYKSAPTLGDALERALLDSAFKKLALLLEETWIQQAIIAFNECQQEMRWTNRPKIFIEMAIISIASETNETEQVTTLMNSDKMEKLLERVATLEKQLQTLQKGETQKTAPARKERRSRPKASSSRGYQVPVGNIRSVLDEAEKRSLQKVQTEWTIFLGRLKEANAPAHATIQDSKPVAASHETLILSFKYEIHCSLFLDHQEMIQSILSEVIGKTLTIIPIPDPDWVDLRTEYLSNQETKKPAPEDEEEGDPLVEEARKLVGDGLLEIHD